MKPHVFDRTVVMSVDVRYPDSAQKTLQALRQHGARDPQPFLNGRGIARLDLDWYDLVHHDEPPATWPETRAGWDYCQAYRAVIRRALDDGVDKLLVCEDDIAFSPEFEAIVSRAMVPDDWGLAYFGAMHFWAEVQAEAVRGHPYIVRLNGGQLGVQAVGWRRVAMKRFLDLPVDRALDRIVAALHPIVPTYCLHPSAIRQAEGVRSAINPDHEPFDSSFIYELIGPS